MSDTGRHDIDESILSAYLDDELDTRERAVVDAKLADSAEWRTPRSLSTAARSVSMRAASSSAAMSATFHWMAWWLAIGLPKVLRWPA